MTHVVIWVQDSGYVFCQVSVQHRLNVVTHVDCRKREIQLWRFRQVPDTAIFPLLLQRDLQQEDSGWY